MNKSKRFKDSFSKKNITDIKSKLEAVLNSKEGGFIIICNQESGVITDMYDRVCADCVLDAVAFTVASATDNGIIPEKHIIKKVTKKSNGKKRNSNS